MHIIHNYHLGFQRFRCGVLRIVCIARTSSVYFSFECLVKCHNEGSPKRHFSLPWRRFFSCKPTVVTSHLVTKCCWSVSCGSWRKNTRRKMTDEKLALLNNFRFVSLLPNYYQWYVIQMHWSMHKWLSTSIQNNIRISLPISPSRLRILVRIHCLKDAPAWRNWIIAI